MDYSKIPIILLFVITTIACCSSGFVRAYFCKRVTSDVKDYYLFNALISLLGFGVLFALGNFDTSISSYTLMLGIAFGIVTMVSSVFNTIAINLGPLSYTMVILNSSTIVTALSGYFIWGEKLTIYKIIFP